MANQKTGGKFGEWLRANPLEPKKSTKKENETVAEMMARCLEQEKKDKKERRRT